jgi:hypothetical protein
MRRRELFCLLLVARLIALPTDGCAFAGSAVLDGPVHDGSVVVVDLPESQRVKNFGVPRTAPPKLQKGLCVFATLDMCARWQNVTPLIGIIEKIPEGGGWPEKVDAVVQQFGEGAEIVQYQGADPTFLDLAMKTGRAVGITYGYGERYNMETIYHMVLLVHFDAKWAAIIDNNWPNTIEWMERDELLKRAKHPSGSYWAYMLIAPPPPPVPCN